MTQKTEPNDAAESVVLECDLPEPPEQVWKALTEPALLAAWLMPNDIRPEPGARFTFQADAEAGGGTIECEVLDVDAPRLLRYSWRSGASDRDAGERALDSVVTFVLAETADGGTHFRLVHDGFPADALQPVASLAMAPPKVVSLDDERLRRRAAPIVATVHGSLRCAA